MESMTRLNSWNAILIARPNDKIEVKSVDLFRRSDWRIGVIKKPFRRGAQHQEPFVLCFGDPECHIYGRATIVRQDNRMIYGKHLDSRKLLEYIDLFEKKDSTDEPTLNMESILHNDMQNGHLSLISINPLLSQKHWNDRCELDILQLRAEIQKHIMKKQESQLSELASRDARDTIMSLKRQDNYNFDHTMESFVNCAFLNKMNYNNKDKIMGKGRDKSSFCTHLNPTWFKKRMRNKMLAAGGRQTVYTPGRECWKVEKLNNSKASKIVLNHKDYQQGARLVKYDPDERRNGWKYTAEQVNFHFSMKTLKFATTYTNELTKKGRRHRRK